jgi:hypothetical protein
MKLVTAGTLDELYSILEQINENYAFSMA